MTTQVERLASIETLLSEMKDANRRDFKRITDKLDKLESDQRKDIADLAALKNRGLGLLIGVGLVGGGVGAGLAKFWASLFG